MGFSVQIKILSCYTGFEKGRASHLQRRHKDKKILLSVKMKGQIQIKKPRFLSGVFKFTTVFTTLSSENGAL